MWGSATLAMLVSDLHKRGERDGQGDDPGLTAGRHAAIDHRDCGAAKVAYGEDSIANPEVETKTHREVLAEFREAVAKHHPQLTVVTGLMALDGSIEIFS